MTVKRNITNKPEHKQHARYLPCLFQSINCGGPKTSKYFHNPIEVVHSLKFLQHNKPCCPYLNKRVVTCAEHPLSLRNTSITFIQSSMTFALCWRFSSFKIDVATHALAWLNLCVLLVLLYSEISAPFNHSHNIGTFCFLIRTNVIQAFFRMNHSIHFIFLPCQLTCNFYWVKI